jgi:hypothetical protein
LKEHARWSVLLARAASDSDCFGEVEPGGLLTGFRPTLGGGYGDDDDFEGEMFENCDED